MVSSLSTARKEGSRQASAGKTFQELLISIRTASKDFREAASKAFLEELRKKK